MFLSADDLIGDIKGFPIEVVKAMMVKQAIANGFANVRVFQENISASSKGGGFTWDETPEGWGFWNDVISGRNFDRFFKEYNFRESDAYTCVRSNSSDRDVSRVLPKMSRFERWLFSKINNDALGRRAKLEDLCEELEQSEHGFGDFALYPDAIDQFDFLLNRGTSRELAHVVGLSDDVMPENLAYFMGDLIQNLRKFYYCVELGPTIISSGRLYLSEIGSLSHLLDWLHRNIALAVRFDGVRIEIKDRLFIVRHIGHVDALTSEWETVNKRFYRKGYHFVIDGEIFLIR